MSGDSSFGTRLKAARRAARLTQEELANRSGISVRTISDLERGLADTPRASTARMLADGLELSGTQRDRFLAVRLAASAGQLPIFRWVLVPPTALIGREDAVAEIGTLLADPPVRLVTLTGPGGVGKTRLAAQVALETMSGITEDVADVDLTNARDEAGMLREIAGALGDADKGTGTDGVSELIGRRSLLLVLDNFEQLVAVAPALSQILARCPRLKVLITSRLPLRIRGEHEVQVPPLEVPEAGADQAAIEASPAVAMFAACARQRRASWRLDAATAEPAADICRAVDGIPLAIELAASHIGALDVAAVAERLGKSARLLSSGPRDLPPRQRTLLATMQWSYDLLDGQAKTLLRWLAVFPAGFTAQAAEEVGGAAPGLPQEAVLGALTTLADVGLIRQVSGPAGMRYQLYQTVREYAREQLDESAEWDAAVAAHAAYMLRLTEPAAVSLVGRDQVAWLDRLEPHREDIRFAIERLIAAGRREDALRLGGAVWMFWHERGHLREGYQLLDVALGDAVPENLDADGCRTWARALDAASTLHYPLGGRDVVRDRYGQAAALWERARDARGQAVTLIHLGQYEHYTGDRRHARTVYAQALAAAREVGEDRPISAVLQNLGTLLVQDGDLDNAEPLLDEALTRIRNVGDVYGEANIQGTRAELALAAGDLDRAHQLATATRKLFEELGDQRGVHEVTRVFADIAAARGDDATAFKLYESAVRGHRGLDDQWGVAEALRSQARAALRLGRADAARSLAREARTLCAEIGDPAGARAADDIIADAS
jgi:predicted ATPase/transcriptional regulator with XRE-family HTH domain